MWPLYPKAFTGVSITSIPQCIHAKQLSTYPYNHCLNHVLEIHPTGPEDTETSNRHRRGLYERLRISWPTFTCRRHEREECSNITAAATTTTGQTYHTNFSTGEQRCRQVDANFATLY